MPACPITERQLKKRIRIHVSIPFTVIDFKLDEQPLIFVTAFKQFF